VPGRSRRPPAWAGDDIAAADTDGVTGDAGATGDWQRHPAFLWGLDLYNHGYPWEAHEVWETLWQQAPRGDAVRVMLQGLIQCAAAVVHARAGRVTGRRRLAERAWARLTAVHAAVGPRCLCIDVAGLAQAIRAYGLAGEAEDWPRITLAAPAPDRA
jgi:hypothetical protein